MVMKRPMVAFLIQLLHRLRSRFSRRAQLEAENVLLRHQLIVLRRRHPGRVKLWNIDRLLLVWLCRLIRPCWTRSSLSDRTRWFAGIDVVSAPTGTGSPVTYGIINTSGSRF